MGTKLQNMEYALRLSIPPMTEFILESAAVESAGRFQVHFAEDVLRAPLLTKEGHV